jgi:hypothetical protein
MFVSKVIVILELFFGEDFKQFGVDGVGIGESLDCGEGSKVVEVVVGIGEERGLECTQ